MKSQHVEHVHAEAAFIYKYCILNIKYLIAHSHDSGNECVSLFLSHKYLPQTESKLSINILNGLNMDMISAVRCSYVSVCDSNHTNDL